MSFDFKNDADSNLITITCDRTTTSNDRLRVINKLVAELVKKPNLHILFDVSQLNTELLEKNGNQFEKLIMNKIGLFSNSKVSIYAGREKYYSRPVLFNAFAFVQKFDNFSLFDNKIIASQWLKD